MLRANVTVDVEEPNLPFRLVGALQEVVAVRCPRTRHAYSASFLSRPSMRRYGPLSRRRAEGHVAPGACGAALAYPSLVA
jgi:hypothetical protein